MEALSWLVLEHFREYDAWPWARFNSIQKQWQEHPSFLVGEFVFIVLTCLSFKHAWTSPDKEARRLKLLWIATFVVGTVNDYIFMMLPVVDNFFQAQAVIMLTPRMPLYIPCVYNAFMYWPAVATSRVFHHRRKSSALAEAALAGLLGGLLYAPYDVCGARFLWWTWHDSDPGVRGRWLGVPSGSTSWTLTFVFSFVLLLRKASNLGWSQPKSLALACLSTPLMIMILNAFTLLGGDEFGAPDVGTVLAFVLAAGLITLRELCRPSSSGATASAASQGLRGPEPAVYLVGLVAYFGILACTMAVFSPEKQISTGVHQAYGPCNATDWDLLGFQRNRYICNERFPDWYFRYDCPDPLPGAAGRWEHIAPWEMSLRSKDGVATWFTICGQPHESFRLWMGAECMLTLLGAIVFTWALSSYTKPGHTAAPDSTTRRKRLTAFGERIKGLQDPLYAPLAERHWNVAVAVLIVVQATVIWILGEVLSAVYPPGNSGTYLRRAYALMQSLPLSDRPYFLFLASGAAHFIVCGVYLALDAWRPPFVRALIKQSRGPGDWDHGLMRTITQQVYCFFTLSIPICVIQYFRNGPSLYTAPWMETCLDQCSKSLPVDAPSLFEFSVHLAFCIVTFNYAYWYVHWQLHRNRHLYKHVHALHHEYKQPFVTVGPCVHPMEFNVVFLFAVVAPMACRAHPLTWITWFILNVVFGLEDHTGYRHTPVGWFFDLVTLGHWGGSMGHNLHHGVVWGNYEPYLVTFDRLCGTDVHTEDAGSATPEWEGAAAQKGGDEASKTKVEKAPLQLTSFEPPTGSGLQRRCRVASPAPPVARGE